MEWLKRLWQELIRDVLLVIVGLGIGISQVFAARPDYRLLLFAMGLISPATVALLLRIGSGQTGTGTPSSPPPGLPSPPPPPGGAGD